LLKGTSFKVTVDSSGGDAHYAFRRKLRDPTSKAKPHTKNHRLLLQEGCRRASIWLACRYRRQVPSTTAPGVKNLSADSAAEKKKRPPLDELVVTGSRIARGALEQPTADHRNQFRRDCANRFSPMPAIFSISILNFGVGTGLSTNQEGYNTDAGATFPLNLRGLGTNRTLVLVDGLRRVSGGSSSSAVDLSTIPANMIERIEIITGGALLGPMARMR